ncbi:hypothetical protein ACSLO7_31580, partial [Klebsiella pneumoniae]
ELNGWIYDNVNNGVYKAGFATSQQAYDEAVDAVFTSLERLEQGRADIVVAPDMHFRSSSEINSRKLYSVLSVYVAAPDH